MPLMSKKNLAGLTLAAAVAVGIALVPASGIAAPLAPGDNVAQLQQAAKSASGPADQARAAAALGHAYWEAAHRDTEQTRAAEFENSLTAARIRRLGNALRSNNLSADALRASDPKAALAEYDKQIAALRGGSAGDTWSVGQSPAQPTLSALKQKVSTLEGDISKRQTDLQSLTSQRDGLSSQADQLAAQSEGEQGRKSVDDFNKSSDLRKQASDVQRRIELAKWDLTPRRQELAVAKAELAATEKAITQLEQEKAVVAGQWDAAGKQIQGRQQSAAALLQGSGDNKDSISAELAELSKGAVRADGLRKQAIDNLSKAAAQFAAAASNAQKLQTELRAKSSGAVSQARQTLMAAIDPQAYQLQNAAVLADRARVQADQAGALLSRGQLAEFLAPAIQKASLTVPAELNDWRDLKSRIDEANQAADKDFTSADDLLKQLETSASVKNGATVLHILTLYGWSHLAAASGDTQNAETRLQSARALAANAAKNNIPLPSLPAEIAPAASSAPATQPA